MGQTPASLIVLRRAVRDWWDDWVNWVVIGLVWILSWLLILPGPPLTFALAHAARETVQGKSSRLGELLPVAWRYVLQSWLWLALNLGVGFLLVVNVLFYANLPSSWGDLLVGLFTFLAYLWWVVQFYALPYLMVQERKHLGIAMRNSLFTALAAPGYTLVLATLGLLLVGLSLVLIVPLALGAPALIGLLGSHAVAERLETYQAQDLGNP